MHEYASNNHFRGPRAYFAIGAIAILLSAWAASLNVEPIVSHLQWILPSSALGLYALLIFLYNRWLWRWFSPMKNLNGTWIGTVKSSFDQSTPTDCVAHIRQSWTRIEITLETEHSRSRTTMAALLGDGLSDTKLQYEYVSEPKGLAVETMQMHRGVCLMRLENRKGGCCLSGDYYTGRGRQTHGEICLTLSGRKLRGFNESVNTA